MAIGVHSTQNNSIVSGGVGDDNTDNQYRQPTSPENNPILAPFPPFLSLWNGFIVCHCRRFLSIATDRVDTPECLRSSSSGFAQAT